MEQRGLGPEGGPATGMATLMPEPRRGSGSQVPTQQHKELRGLVPGGLSGRGLLTHRHCCGLYSLWLPPPRTPGAGLGPQSPGRWRTHPSPCQRPPDVHTRVQRGRAPTSPLQVQRQRVCPHVLKPPQAPKKAQWFSVGVPPGGMGNACYHGLSSVFSPKFIH